MLRGGLEMPLVVVRSRQARLRHPRLLGASSFLLVSAGIGLFVVRGWVATLCLWESRRRQRRPGRRKTEVLQDPTCHARAGDVLSCAKTFLSRSGAPLLVAIEGARVIGACLANRIASIEHGGVCCSSRSCTSRRTAAGASLVRFCSVSWRPDTRRASGQLNCKLKVTSRHAA